VSDGEGIEAEVQRFLAAQAPVFLYVRFDDGTGCVLTREQLEALPPAVLADIRETQLVSEQTPLRSL
jgi:hypothetical protein